MVNCTISLPATVVMTARLSACIGAALYAWIYVKFEIDNFYEILFRNIPDFAKIGKKYLSVYMKEDLSTLYRCQRY
jgi:hypothetical protein